MYSMTDKEFNWLDITRGTSGCAKKQIAAGTFVNGAWVRASNTCNYDGLVCPRLELPTSQGYDLCRAEHAESRLADELLEFGLVSDGIAWVLGHYYVCEPCAAKLKSVGVKEIRVRESV